MAPPEESSICLPRSRPRRSRPVTILPLLLTAAIALSAALATWAEHRGVRRMVYVFKPLTTILILALAATAHDAVSLRYQALVCAGLLFSLAGDVFLMLPRDRFIAGLASFLVAHGFYIAAFAPWPPTLEAPGALLVLVFFGWELLRALWNHLGRLRMPVAVYAAALLGMAWQRFAERLRYGQVVVLSTYFAAQWLIALSVAARPFG